MKGKVSLGEKLKVQFRSGFMSRWNTDILETKEGEVAFSSKPVRLA